MTLGTQDKDRSVRHARVYLLSVAFRALHTLCVKVGYEYFLECNQSMSSHKGNCEQKMLISLLLDVDE